MLPLNKTPWYVWRTFFYIWTCWIGKPSADYNGTMANFDFKKGRQTAITICSGLPHPAEQLAEVRRDLISWQILDLCFSESQGHYKIEEVGCQEIQV